MSDFLIISNIWNRKWAINKQLNSDNSVTTNTRALKNERAAIEVNLKEFDDKYAKLRKSSNKAQRNRYLRNVWISGLRNNTAVLRQGDKHCKKDCCKLKYEITPVKIA